MKNVIRIGGTARRAGRAVVERHAWSVKKRWCWRVWRSVDQPEAGSGGASGHGGPVLGEVRVQEGERHREPLERPDVVEPAGWTPPSRAPDAEGEQEVQPALVSRRGCAPGGTARGSLPVESAVTRRTPPVDACAEHIARKREASPLPLCGCQRHAEAANLWLSAPPHFPVPSPCARSDSPPALPPARSPPIAGHAYPTARYWDRLYQMLQEEAEKRGKTPPPPPLTTRSTTTRRRRTARLPARAGVLGRPQQPAAQGPDVLRGDAPVVLGTVREVARSPCDRPTHPAREHTHTAWCSLRRRGAWPVPAWRC